MIYAKTGLLIDNNKDKIFQLFDGKVINNKNNKTNIFEFQEINFYLKGFDSKTIVAPKIQEISSKKLFLCLIDNEQTIDEFKCTKQLTKQFKQELLKRLYKPIYIPVIAIMCCYLFLTSNKRFKNFSFKRRIFLIIFFILVVSETSLRYSTNSNISLIIYFLTPFIFNAINLSNILQKQNMFKIYQKYLIEEFLKKFL